MTPIDPDELSHRRWRTVVFLLVAMIGISLIWFVQQVTTSISDALAEEVLRQQHDVANLLHEYKGVMLELERKKSGTKTNSVKQVLSDANQQLDSMLFTYSFEKLDGAARMHAVVKPVLEDVEQWLVEGGGGLGAADPVLISIAAKRMADRYDSLRSISDETSRTARLLISEQAAEVDKFRLSLIYLVGGFALLSLGISALLFRQRKLQNRLRRDQQNFAQRLADFAYVGADWFWEMTPEFRVNVVSGRSLTVDDSRLNDQVFPAEPDTVFTAYEDKIADVHWPIEYMQAHEEFTEFESEWMPSKGERQVVSMSGKPLFDKHGAFLGYRGIGRDVTRRKAIEAELEAVYQELVESQKAGRQQAEQALRDSEQFLGISLDAMAARIAIIDQDGLIKVTNKAWKTYFGDSVSDGGVGGFYLDAFSSRPKAELRSFSVASGDIEDVLSGATASLHYEFPCNLPDQRRWMVIDLTTFESNGVRYAVLVFEDVTDRRNLEEQDRKMRADLAHVSRLTTAGEMATVLAHELNQPLTAISHNSDALLSQLTGKNDMDPDIMETLSDIYEQSQRAGGIIQSMRQMVRKDSQETTRTDINQLVVDTVRLTQPEAREHNIDVHLQLAENLPNLMIDPVQIQQVLVNLERNSVEAIKNHGLENGQLYISTVRDDHEFVRVTVQDTGPGFTEEIEHNMFKSFQSTKIDGMGMGLSISRSIVEAHGGRLFIDRPQNGMTTFHFTLPLVRA